jgi:hypothetical protein
MRLPSQARPVARNVSRGKIRIGEMGPSGGVECSLCHLACSQIPDPLGQQLCHIACEQAVC